MDIHDQQLDMVRKLGAIHTFNSRTEGPSLPQTIQKTIGQAGGIAAVIVTSGASQAYNTAIDIVGIKGQIIITGVPNKPLPIYPVSDLRVQGDLPSPPQPTYAIHDPLGGETC